ncbi:MAG TPA: hypothetical protein DFI00_00330 [Rhodospirillaceae bacterium]|mgnify:CR=1 FL=1|nr:hypothetical protein [Alphaproteobacteria bacterium]OUT40948.1 MAG: hypothetical protein CBB62_00835 [Micavibrio sp. TMED2]HCI45717.1 hypothetical protein [Rhodospirillaceae bacterium]MAS47567.1 hypothetical protein [Alphaproteobacteria bacterium]MAX96561.1 hypothetical protein [Alphaproteobacteria bacterium]|tara:strand:- start:259 stop:996 length:738 start_codon:yes stop_codon:yes gene_type:complete
MSNGSIGSYGASSASLITPLNRRTKADTVEGGTGSFNLKDARRANEKLQRVLDQMKRLNDPEKRRAEREAMAKEKVERAQARLRQMMMFGASEEALRQVAKELEDAIRELKAIAGSTGSVPSTTGSSVSEAKQAAASADSANTGTDADIQAETAAASPEASVKDSTKAAGEKLVKMLKQKEQEEANSPHAVKKDGTTDATELERILRLAETLLKITEHMIEEEEEEEAKREGRAPLPDSYLDLMV